MCCHLTIKKNLVQAWEKTLLKTNYQVEGSIGLSSLFPRKTDMAGPNAAAHQYGSVALKKYVLAEGKQPIVLLWPLKLVLSHSRHIGQVNMGVTSVVLVDVDLRKKPLSFIHSSDEISHFKLLRLSLYLNLLSVFHLVFSLLPVLGVHAVLANLAIPALFTILTLLAILSLLAVLALLQILLVDAVVVEVQPDTPGLASVAASKISHIADGKKLILFCH
jgi:hypothetical protein